MKSATQLEQLKYTPDEEYDRDKEIEGIRDLIIAGLIEEIDKKSDTDFIFAEYTIPTTNFSKIAEINLALSKAFTFFEEAGYKTEKLEFLMNNDENKSKTKEMIGLRVDLR